MIALNYMLTQYETLKTLSRIAEESPQPTRYHCTVRELLLQSNADWKAIQADLRQLATESLVTISEGDTPLFCITDKGIAKIRMLEGLPSR